MSDHQFKLQINLTKAYKDSDGNAFLEGIASGPEVDLTGERMSAAALASMVASIQKRLVEFRDAHKDEWNDDLGEIVELSLTDDYHLFYKAKLDLNLSGAKDLWYRVHDLGKKLGVSIGGSVIKAGYEYMAELGREVFTYFDVDLYEISITRQAAYQYSFANAVVKSLPKQGAPMTKTDTVEKTDELEHNDAETQNDTNLTESEAAASADALEDAQETTETQSEGDDASQENAEDAAEQSDADTDDSQEADTTEEAVETSEDADEQSEAEATSDVSQDAEAQAAPAAEEDSADGEAVAKALTEANAHSTQLQKALDESTAKVTELQKSLDAKTDALATASHELEETKKSLADKETELEKRNARKALVFGKFDGVELAKANPHNDQESKTLQRWLNS